MLFLVLGAVIGYNFWCFSNYSFSYRIWEVCRNFESISVSTLAKHLHFCKIEGDLEGSMEKFASVFFEFY